MPFIPTILVVSCLLGFVVVGLSILVWLAPVSAAEMTPAQDKLIDIADWMTKASIGALLGFAGSKLATSRTSSASR